MDMPLSLTLTRTGGAEARAVLVVDPLTPSCLISGRATLRAKITECSFSECSSHFSVAVAIPGAEATVATAHTAVISIINHQLRLSPGLVWEGEWYKDEGGRDKCLTIPIDLRDSQASNGGPIGGWFYETADRGIANMGVVSAHL